MTLTKEMATSREVSASRQQVWDAMADRWTYTPGTIHLGADGDGLVRWMADLNTRVVPEHPFMLLGQTTTADPSRSPAGNESVWAYTHLPRNVADDASAERLANRSITLSKNMHRGLVRE